MRYRYRTLEFGTLDVHLRALRDTNEFEDRDGVAALLGISEAMWPLFGVVWPSARALAALMVHAPTDGHRFLEIGCGLGLASLVLAKRGADVTATDRHPEVAGFLARNAALNDLSPIPFVRTDWSERSSPLGRFDRIVGSDLLHDREQAAPLARFVHDHAEARCEVVLVDPGRGQANAFGRALQELGFTQGQRRAIHDDLNLQEPVGAREQIYTFRRG